ncbi:hypothetical protein [Acinetobacter sp. MD2(2019)]|uniref:hypothetical protein n=1 Tax=Acinetobacter sp. MD2(2019) TaxID=2605273 RepID=UPI002D1F69FB|nr:hypothetical protein [Acinetobacter sp. MD2(2019)]MEB3754544.1 hypothetical protein [Acinetobacter sp. MD2(2019)]
MNGITKIDWQAWIGNISLIIIFREAALWVMTKLQFPELGNLVGLISLLLCMLIWRKFKPISLRLVDTNNKIMRESAFAFLPVCAGSLLTLVHMGKEIPLFLFILCVSTLIPLWVYAKMSKHWL